MSTARCPSWPLRKGSAPAGSGAQNQVTRPDAKELREQLSSGASATHEQTHTLASTAAAASHDATT